MRSAERPLLLVPHLYDVATRQGFTVAEMPANRNRHYQQATVSPLRCVDDRPVAPHHQEFALGIQIQGCTYGIAHGLSKVTGLSEDHSLKVVNQALGRMGIAPSSHTHCGYLAKSEQGLFPHVKPRSVDERLRQITDLNGVILHLDGDHKPAVAIVNLVPNQTLNTQKALEEKEPAFNQDLWAIPLLARRIKEQGTNSFSADELTAQVLTDYLTTIYVLTGSTQVYFRE